MKHPLSHPGDAVEAALAAAFAATGEEPRAPIRAEPRVRFWAVRRHTAIVALLCITALLSILLSAGAWLASRPPSWWASLEPTPETDATAQALERGLVNTIQRPRRHGETWIIEVRASDANAWLATRLPKWLAHEGADLERYCRDAALRFEPGRITLAARLAGPSAERIVLTSFRPRITTSGALHADDVRLGVGRLALPLALGVHRLLPELPQNSDTAQASARIVKNLTSGQPLTPTATIALDDGRRVRLLDLRVEQDRLLLTCRCDLP